MSNYGGTAKSTDLQKNLRRLMQGGVSRGSGLPFGEVASIQEGFSSGEEDAQLVQFKIRKTK